MRQALRRSVAPRAAVAVPYSFNAPVKGWFVGADIAEMPEGSAYVLDNWFPEVDSLRLREGYDEFATLLSAAETPIDDPIGTLMVHSAGGVDTIFAAVDAYIIDITAGGDVEDAVGDLSTMTADQYIWTNFSTSGGNYLYIVNGADSARHYDGTAWATPSITGATSSTFSYVFPCKSRLFFIEENSTTVHFLPTDSIQGAAQQLEVGGELTLGGTLVAGAAITLDSGEGVDDYCCLISSEGEVVIYDGTDPSDARDWTKRGTFRIGRPIGDRCVLKIGGDIAVLCSDGVASLSQSILLDRAAAERGTFTQNIRDAFSDQYELTGTTDGWQLLTWPKAHMGIVNVPITALTTYRQYVMNVMSGAWAQFKGINATCWLQAGDKLYFGTVDGRIMEFGAVGLDETTSIEGRAVLAWDEMKRPGLLKHVTEARMFMRSDQSTMVGAAVAVDFANVETPATSVMLGDTSGALWDVAQWDEDVFSAPVPPKELVLGLGAVGQFIAPVIFAQSQTASVPNVRFLALTVLYETGAFIG